MRIASLFFTLLPLLAEAQIPEPVWDAHIGTSGADRIEDAFLAMDGSVLVAGNLAAPLEQLGELAVPPSAGSRVPEDPKYGVALLARLDAESGAPIAAMQFPEGLLHLSRVVATEGAVYASGYATANMEELVRDKISFRGEFDSDGEQLTVPTPHIHRHDPLIDKGRDGRGRPVVVRLTPDLAAITAVAFLEGWHHIWHVPQPLKEDRQSPVGLGLLSNGDVVVAHDGGQNFPDPNTGEANFYHGPDFLSLLSPDLSRRRWHTRIETPKVEPARVRALLGDDFTHDWMGNVRTMQLRVAPDDRIFVCGWSASQTMKEPWWSPFLYQIDPLNGEEVWSGWTVDPTGSGGRMGGLVSDSVVRSIAFDEQGRLLAALNSDGGNSITTRQPHDYKEESPRLKGDSPWGLRGRTLFIGNVQRLDLNQEERLGGAFILGRSNRTATAAWPIDLAALPGGGVFVVGRYTKGFSFKHAWDKATGPGSFLRIYTPEFDLGFSTGLEGADLRTVHRRGDYFVVSGGTRRQQALGRGAFGGRHKGSIDGYVLLLRVPPER
ncbi:MAG: hypothetical protein ACLFU4_05490 [Opitutales bacterium]